MPCLDFLDGTDVQTHSFRELFLRQPPSGPLPADAGAEMLELRRLQPVQWHALLRRKSLLTRTAQWGVIPSMAQNCRRGDSVAASKQLSSELVKKP